ncbi:MAG: LPS export ABC transporter periplasmic protein LptC [Algiphilus sp.]
MRSGREWFLALVLGVLIVIWGANLTREGARDTQEVVDLREPPRYIVRDARWLRTNVEGAPLYRIEAEQLAVYADDRIVIHAPEVQGLGQRDAWSLVAPRGDIPAGSRNLELSDGVDVTGQWGDGQALQARTERLTVDVEERLLRTTDPVRITGPGRDLRSVGLRTDWEAERLNLLDQVQGTYDARYGVAPQQPARRCTPGVSHGLGLGAVRATARTGPAGDQRGSRRTRAQRHHAIQRQRRAHQRYAACDR